MSIVSAVFCQALSRPSNGAVEYSIGLHNLQNGGYTVDTVATVNCNSGYRIQGSSSRTCQPSGGWSGQMSTCNIGKKTRYYVHKIQHLTFCSILSL